METNKKFLDKINPQRCCVTLNSLFIIRCLRLWNVSLPINFVVSMQFQHSDARIPPPSSHGKIALSYVVDNG